MKTRKFLIALVAILALFAAACGDDDDPVASSGGNPDGGSESPDGPDIKIGAQDFGESAILAEIYGQVLADHGYTVEQVSVGGFRDVLLGAFDNGDVNLSAEYAASMLEFLNEGAGEATGDAAETVGLLQAQLDSIGLVALDPAPAVDTNAFVITQETSESEGYTKISDLPADGSGLKLGAPQDCETNPFCLVGLESVYGIDLSGGFTPLESGLVADALADGSDVNIGVLFSTSGRIADEGWVLLEDDMNMLAADNITPVISDELAEAYGDDLTTLLNEISAAIDTDTLTELNKRFEIDKEDAADIAADFIADAGL
ncbi:ABC transporter substrate-binding protein [Actinospongicola halichondriae]|uniref:ABC transporter substrate-binding protein n=1 Tax=Actinospongicola halichondriae TaxID=3236844 RepID=UPI003D42A356